MRDAGQQMPYLPANLSIVFVRPCLRNSHDVTGYAMTEQTTDRNVAPTLNGQTICQLSRNTLR